MPSSPIAKKLDTLPDNWVHLQKTMIPDTETSCYWGHVEDLDGDCMNVLTVIEAVYGVDFKDSMWFPMTATEVPSLEEIRKSCGE